MEKVITFIVLVAVSINAFALEPIAYPKYDCFISSAKKSSIIEFSDKAMTYENMRYLRCDESDIKEAYRFKLNCNSESENAVYINPRGVYGAYRRVTIADPKNNIKDAVCYPIYDSNLRVDSQQQTTNNPHNYDNWK
jgi:hypothetical protein